MSNNIVRRPDFAGGGITEEEKKLMDRAVDFWCQQAMRTAPIEPAKIVPAIKALYAAAGKKEPRVIIVPSPICMAVSFGFASAILYARKTDWHDTKHAATRAATYDATAAATDAATAAATELPAGWAVSLARKISRGNRNLEALMLSCTKRWYSCYQGGNMWAAWACYLGAARDILGLRLPVHEKYKAWEDCALHGAFRVMHEDFCIVSDFPAKICKDDQHRPHCDDGPSHLWRDGWALWFIHGVRVNKQIVEAPATLTVRQIEQETNQEIRRIMIERFGQERFIKESGAAIIHQDRDPQNGDLRRLYRKEVNGDEPIVMVAVKNSTPEPDGSIKDYFIRVPPDMETTQQALAWTFGMKASEYIPQVQT